MTRQKQKIFFIFFIILLFFLIGFYFFQKNNEKPQTFEIVVPSPSQITEPSPTPKEEPAKELPLSFKIEKIPFTPQAPFANWDFDHKEACEEAAILMAHFFYEGKTLNPEIADKELMGMVNYQKKNWGGHFDLEAKEIAKLAKEYYGYQNPRIVYDISIEDIKKEIAKENPVILPTAGRLLKNPYYRQPGPLYHALVVIGYTQDKIITHDPGTKRGENYSYSYAIIESAMHEWNKGDVLNGRRAMILLK